MRSILDLLMINVSNYQMHYKYQLHVIKNFLYALKMEYILLNKIVKQMN